MDLETLKKMLAEGKITQAEFDEKVKALGSEGEKKPELSAELKGYIAGLIQSETDKVRTEYAQKLKAKEDELKAVQDKANSDLKTKMTEAEKLAFEKKLQDEQYQKEKEDFAKQRREFNALTKLTEYELLDKDKSFLDLVADDDENMIDLRCKKLKSAIDLKVKEAVDKTFKDNGRDFGGSDNNGSDGKNKDEEFGKELAKSKKAEVENSKKAEEYYFGKE